MFTGIIKQIGVVTEVVESKDGKELTILVLDTREIEIGDSVAVLGCCLTVTSKTNSTLTFFVSRETLKTTTLAGLMPKISVNIELALQMKSFLGGHIVLGHVDEVGTILEIEKSDLSTIIKLEVSGENAKFLVKKGSITIDGVSLTVMDINKNIVTLNVIPHTIENTTLKNLNTKVNNIINVEYDHLVKIIVKTADVYFKNMAN